MLQRIKTHPVVAGLGLLAAVVLGGWSAVSDRPILQVALGDNWTRVVSLPMHVWLAFGGMTIGIVLVAVLLGTLLYRNAVIDTLNATAKGSDGQLHQRLNLSLHLYEQFEANRKVTINVRNDGAAESFAAQVTSIDTESGGWQHKFLKWEGATTERREMLTGQTDRLELLTVQTDGATVRNVLLHTTIGDIQLLEREVLAGRMIVPTSRIRFTIAATSGQPQYYEVVVCGAIAGARFWGTAVLRRVD